MLGCYYIEMQYEISFFETFTFTACCLFQIRSEVDQRTNPPWLLVGTGRKTCEKFILGKVSENGDDQSAQ